MTIKEISDTLIRGEKAITFPLSRSGSWVVDKNNNNILNTTVFGFHLLLAKNREELKAAFADWVVYALNEQYEVEMTEELTGGYL